MDQMLIAQNWMDQYQKIESYGIYGLRIKPMPFYGKKKTTELGIAMAEDPTPSEELPQRSAESDMISTQAGT